MKVVISLDKPKIQIVVEGADASLSEIGDVVEQSLMKIKKVWLDAS